MRKIHAWKEYRRYLTSDMRWLIIWAFIYIGFLTLDIVTPHFIGSSLLKYIGIFLCIVYVNQKYHDDFNLQLALLFTLLADTLLVWTPFTNAGVYAFCFAQFMHLVRLTKLKRLTLCVIACTLSFICALLVALGIDPLFAIAAVYGIELISNLVMATKNYFSNRSHFRASCAFYGFCAFFCCDLCVALRFAGLSGAFTGPIVGIVSYLVWVFYYPSQVLIANSSTQEKSPRKFAKSKRIR